MKTLSVALAAVLAFSVAAFAADAAKPADAKANRGWFEDTLKGLKSKVNKRFEAQNARVAQVAAVRASDMSKDAKAPYWKGGGKDKQQKKYAAERKQFTSAVELVLSGKTDEGKAALEKFLKDNPQSQFTPDVKDALAKLAEGVAPAEQAKPAAPEAKTEEKAEQKAESQKTEAAPAKPAAPAPAETGK